MEAARALIPEGYHPEMEKLLELDLRPYEAAVIVGAYKGLTAQIIHEAYDCLLYCLEPQPDMAAQARERLPEHAKVFEFGLSNRSGEFPMVEHGNDAASFHLQTSERQPGTGQLRDTVDWWHEQGLTDVGLLLMNCEGGEFEILQRMLDENLLRHCRWLLIQFHIAAVDGDREQVDRWVRTLSNWFEITWTTGLAWTLWRRRN